MPRWGDPARLFNGGKMEVDGIVSRSLDDLSEAVRPMAKELLLRCNQLGIELLVTTTYRDNIAQANLYAQGRTRWGPILTNAKPGQSAHNKVDTAGKPASTALDVVPMIEGKPVWRTVGKSGAIWLRVGELGEQAGLRWAGRWQGKLREYAHFEG